MRDENSGGGGMGSTGWRPPKYYYPTDFGNYNGSHRDLAVDYKMDYWNQTGELAPWQINSLDWFTAGPGWPSGDGLGDGGGQGSWGSNQTQEDAGSGGGGGGGPVEPPPITWDEKYQASGAPDWWRGLVPSRYDPQTEYATMLNSMLPYMSPEDQRYTASILYRMYPKEFGLYNPETTKMPTIPGEMTTDERREMTSRRRAKELLGILEKVKQVSGKDAEFGPGYSYLRQLASTMRDFGGKKTAGQTRQQFAQMMAALDPLTAETQGSQLSAYSSLTRMLSQPYYTAGRVTPTSQLENGQTVFGEPIRNYF